jgi:hypothetical protein
LGADELLAAALRGEVAPWPLAAAAGFDLALLDSAREHGVSPLLTTTVALRSWPDHVQQALLERRREEAVIEAVRRQELGRVIAAFRQAGIRCLIIKGAQLAYTHYSQPWLRPRVDADLLIDAVDRERAGATLRTLGYVAKNQISGTLVAHQQPYERHDRYGLSDTIDLHWKVTNPHLFAGVLTFDELFGAARPIPQLGDAPGPSAAHALLLACVHRVAHHQNSDLLIWLYDIHLLAQAMDAAEREQFVELARSKRLRSICAAGLDLAQRRLGTALPPGWLEQLTTDADDVEPSAAFLQHGVRRIDLLLLDLRALGGWARKARLLRETVFPPAAYVRARYGPDTPLVFAYLDRVVSGARNWFRHSP